MTVKQNPTYAIEKVHQSLRERSEQTINHKTFETVGIYNFGGLDLGNYLWTEGRPTYDSGEVIASVKKDGTVEKKQEDLIKTVVYRGPTGTAVLVLDLENDYHQMSVFAKGHSKNNPKIIQDIRQMFERELKCKWNDSELVEMVKSN